MNKKAMYYRSATDTGLSLHPYHTLMYHINEPGAIGMSECWIWYEPDVELAMLGDRPALSVPRHNHRYLDLARLTLSTLYGPPPDGDTDRIGYKDGNVKNVSVHNLYWRKPRSRQEVHKPLDSVGYAKDLANYCILEADQTVDPRLCIERLTIELNDHLHSEEFWDSLDTQS